jgi:hypothetical protein
MPVKRTNAVMPTAIAPITEKKSCQRAEGIITWAKPPGTVISDGC